MGKKKYIRPEIREESYILTVRAWVTYASAWATDTTTSQAVLESNTSVWVQDRAQRPTASRSSYMNQWMVNFWAAINRR